MVGEKMKALHKDFWMEIRKSKARFISIFVIVTLGVAFFSGIQASSPDMLYSGDAYFDSAKLMNIKVVGTMGLTQEDVEVIKAIDGVEGAEGAYSTDVLCGQEGSQKVLHVESINETVNKLTIKEGEIPNRSGELFLDSSFAEKQGVKLGDTISLVQDKDSELLKKETYTVVGIGTSPLYISFNRGNTTLGSGEISGFAYVCPEDFDPEIYTQIYLTVHGAEDLTSYTDAYENLIDKIQKRVEGIEEERCQIRYEDIVSEAKQKLADARKELADGKKEADEKLADAWQELEDAKKALEDGRKEIEDGAKQLADAKKELTDGKKELQDARTEIADGKAQIEKAKEELADGHRQLEDARKKVSDGQTQLASAKSELNSGWAQINANQTELDKGVAQLNAAKQQVSDGLAQIQDGKATLDARQAELDAGKAQIEAGSEEIASAKADLESKKQECQSGLFQVEAGEAQLSESQTQLEQSRIQLAGLVSQLEGLRSQLTVYQSQYEEAAASGTASEEELAALQGQIAAMQEQVGALEPQVNAYQAEVDAGAARLEESRQQLAATRSELENGLTSIEAGLAQITQKEAELAISKQQIVTGQTEIDNARSEIAQKEKELAAAQEEINQNESALSQGQAQIDAAKQELYAGQAKIDSSEAELADGQEQVNANEQKLADGEKEIQANEKKISDGEKEIRKNERALSDGWRKIGTGEQNLAFARKELASGQKKLEDGQKEYEEAKADAEQEIADGEQKIADAEQELNDLKQPEWIVTDRNDLPEYSDYGDNADRIRNLGQVFPVIFFLVAALISLTTMTRMVEEERTQIGTLKALGYSKFAIASKYLKYAFLATVGGSVAGTLIGEKIIPYIVINGYGIMYHNMASQLYMKYELKFALMASAASVVCTVGATIFSCYKSLAESPAALMRPPAPKEGKRILLERIPFVWKHINFSWKSTLRNLFRYKKRLFMTIFGIAGSVGLMLVGFGLQDSIMDIAVRQYNELQLYDGTIIFDGDASQMEKDDLMTYLEGSDKLENFNRITLTKMEIPRNKSNLSAYVYVPENPEKFKKDVSLRNRKTGKTYELDDSGAVICEKTADMLNLQIGDFVTLKKDNEKYKVKVSFITENYMGHYVYMSPAVYEETFGEKPDYENIVFTMKEEYETDMEETGNEIMECPAVLSISYTSSLFGQLERMLSTLGSVVLVLIVSAGLLSFVVLYNLNNINITERQRELATLKVLGFFDGEVSMYVLRENILLTLIGIAVGGAFGIFLHRFVISTVEVDAVMFGRTIGKWSYFYSDILTFGFSMFVNLVMHFKMKKIDMVESLKSVE